jgi:hypothetical protein
MPQANRPERQTRQAQNRHFVVKVDFFLLFLLNFIGFKRVHFTQLNYLSSDILIETMY